MNQHPESWFDILGIVIIAIPAVIAAVSSLINGKKLDRHVNGPVKTGTNGGHQSSKKKKRPADWFKPPEF